MIQDRVRIARVREQDLAIILVVDFDPAGMGMGKSISRKAELEGAIQGVDVETKCGCHRNVSS